MNYTSTKVISQASIFDSLYQKDNSPVDKAIEKEYGKEVVQDGYLILPSMMNNFKQTSAVEVIEKPVKAAKNGRQRKVYRVHGCCKDYNPNQAYICHCGCDCTMRSIGTTPITLKTIPYLGIPMEVIVQQQRLHCHSCGATYTFTPDFKAEDHRITLSLEHYICGLLAYGFTVKEVSHLTDTDKNVVADIDRKRLKELYTENGKLKKPQQYAEYIGIDEFKLHDGHKFATVIVDLITGHVLYLAHGKKKSVVYDFIAYVGEEWMNHVKVVASDMNSDYQEAFKEKCPWIDTVYDHFHIVKNFNDKVISEVRKDEQKRLIDEGNTEAATALKNTKYIVTSSRKHLKDLDKEAKQGKVLQKESNLFNHQEVKARDGYYDRYEELIKENKLLFTCDLVKEMLAKAYTYKQTKRMQDKIEEIIDICRGTENKHFLWFAKLLESHLDGIVTHAKYNISSGKVEGINNKIKTIRRKSYGLPNDEYFFLKIIDASYHKDRFS